MPRLLRSLELASLMLMLALCPLLAQAKEQRLSYAKELKPLLALTDPQFDRMQGLVLLRQVDSSRACPGATVRLVERGRTRQLAIAADGRVDVPLAQGLADRGAQLWLQKPDSAPPCQLFANVTAKLPAGLEWRYRDLVVLNRQLQAFLKRSAGGLSLFAPELRGLLIRFDGDRSARLTLHAASGDIVLPATRGELRLPMDEQLAKENPAVSLSVRAAAIDAWLE
ncbi:DUF2987 domain-containing protein [Arenimonas sp. MALMAid1274]|uniref:DUF2987 domain-containing protein n=1 Tax=Arenimonas sp. MALMAid1274 TaxID=3411630 RepID=UPI003B9FA7EE